MNNPMLRHLNRNATPSRMPKLPGTSGNMNPMQMINEFAKFKKAMQGRDPQAILNQLIERGEMSPEQLEELKGMAQNLLSILK